MATQSISILLFVLSQSLVQADYPPPSEDGHGYYSRRPNNGPSAGGSGRASVSYGSIHDWPGSDWSSLNGGHGSARCVDIPSNLSLCRNMEYSQMRLPNLLEHDTLREVSQQAGSWVRLLDVRCHADTQVFLCSLFAPVCLDRPVWPCRSLCEAVKSGCEDRMLRYGFPWPDMLRCDQYPLDDDLCIGLRTTVNKESDDLACPACAQPATYDNLIDNFCTSDIAMRIKVEQTVVSGEDLKVVAAKKRKIFKTSASLRPKEARDMALHVAAGAHCDCSQLEHSRQSTSFLIMGHKDSDRVVIDSVFSLDQRSTEVARAVRAMRDRNICRHGVKTSTTVATSMISTKGSKLKVNQKKDKIRRTTTPSIPSALTMTTTQKSRLSRGRSQMTVGHRQQQGKVEKRVHP